MNRQERSTAADLPEWAKTCPVSVVEPMRRVVRHSDRTWIGEKNFQTLSRVHVREHLQIHRTLVRDSEKGRERGGAVAVQ